MAKPVVGITAATGPITVAQHSCCIGCMIHLMWDCTTTRTELEVSILGRRLLECSWECRLAVQHFVAGCYGG